MRSPHGYVSVALAPSMSEDKKVLPTTDAWLVDEGGAAGTINDPPALPTPGSSSRHVLSPTAPSPPHRSEAGKSRPSHNQLPIRTYRREAAISGKKL